MVFSRRIYDFLTKEIRLYMWKLYDTYFEIIRIIIFGIIFLIMIFLFLYYITNGFCFSSNNTVQGTRQAGTVTELNLPKEFIRK
jgi:hypothetical protein